MSDPELKDIKEYERLLADEIKKIEQQIYDEETKYLEDTASCGNSHIYYLGNIIKGWDGYLNKPTKPQTALTQKKPRLYACERIFSASSVTSPLNKEDEAHNHPILKRKAPSSLIKTPKDLDKLKSNKKLNKHKKLKNKIRKRTPYDSSSEVHGFSAMKEENNESLEDMSDMGGGIE